MADPTADLRDFLQSNFDTSNVTATFSTSDDIVVSDPESGPEYPEVAIVSTDPITPGGGQTGFTGQQGDGSGPTQDVIWSITVDCWGGTEQTDQLQTDGVHPDDAATEIGEEVHRVCFENNAASPPSGYEWVNADPPFENNDTEDDPPAYRQTVVCRLFETRES